ncbi:MAG: hypothetical protein ACI8V4_003579, partial [Ilumatobacter sp.]
ARTYRAEIPDAIRIERKYPTATDRTDISDRNSGNENCAENAHRAPPEGDAR